MTEIQIVNEIVNYISQKGGDTNDWYVGITNNPEIRLYLQHSVNEDDPHICKEAESIDSARLIETYFINQLGTDGGNGGGLPNSRFVYAYQKNWTTKP